jgi:hypothetical protein
MSTNNVGSGDDLAATSATRADLRPRVKSVTTVNARGQITIPQEMRATMHVAAGDQLFWEQAPNGFRLSAFPPQNLQAICATSDGDRFCVICVEPETGRQVTFPGIRKQALVARGVPAPILLTARQNPGCWVDVSTGDETNVHTTGQESYRVREPK